jgi:hypothetical protein
MLEDLVYVICNRIGLSQSSPAAVAEGKDSPSMSWNDVISETQYPHWLMAAGGALVVVGFIGFIFQKNTKPGNGQEIPPPDDRSRPRSSPAGRLPPPPPFLLDSRD